jgi:hypothetical protein
MVEQRPGREHTWPFGRPKGDRRRAVLCLRGVDDLPAAAVLEVADQVRQAVVRLGISDVRVEVGSEEDEPAGPAGEA